MYKWFNGWLLIWFMFNPGGVWLINICIYECKYGFMDEYIMDG